MDRGRWQYTITRMYSRLMRMAALQLWCVRRSRRGATCQHNPPFFAGGHCHTNHPAYPHDTLRAAFAVYFALLINLDFFVFHRHGNCYVNEVSDKNADTIGHAHANRFCIGYIMSP